MTPIALLAKHSSGELFDFLVTHSLLVTGKARDLATSYLRRHPQAKLDLEFLTEAAILHDIGIGRCDAPEIHCHGSEPYIRHGVIGREILEAEGLPRHALVCERHSGSGISAAEVRDEKLPMPLRDYVPVSLEEKIICVADKFYSKVPDNLWREKPPREIRQDLERWGQPSAERWLALDREILSGA